jgi:hypothetical protein
MNEIAQMTYNQCVVAIPAPEDSGTLTSTFHRNDFVEIMEMLDKRLNDKGKNWRHVFKVHFLVVQRAVAVVLTLWSHLAGRP